MPTPRAGESEEAFVGRCMKYPDLQDKPHKQRLGECYGIYREHRGSEQKSDHPDQDQYAEDLALARKERYRKTLKDLLAKYGKKGKGCGGHCGCADCTEKEDDDEGEELDYKAMEAEEDKSVLAPSPHHPVSAGRRAVTGSIMTPRQRLNHYDSGKKEWTFEAKPGEPLEVVGYEQHGGMRVRNKKGQEAVVGEHNLRFVRHPRGHKEPKQTGGEEPYHRDKPEGGGGGTCKPGQTASETGCSPKSLQESYGIVRKNTKDSSGHEHGEDGKFTGGGGGKGGKKKESGADSRATENRDHLNERVRKDLQPDIDRMGETEEGRATLEEGASLASKVKEKLQAGVEAALSAIDAESKGGISLIAGGFTGNDPAALAAGAAHLFGAVFQCVHEEVFEHALSQHALPGAHAVGMVASQVAVKAEQSLLKAVAWAWAKTTGKSEKAGLILSRKADHELTEADNEVLDTLAELAADALEEVTGGEADEGALREKIRGLLS